MSIPIAIRRKGPSSACRSVYTQRDLRIEARRLAGVDTLVAAHVEVVESTPQTTTLVVEHRNRAGTVTVSRCAL
jgi:hypothetical protein